MKNRILIIIGLFICLCGGLTFVSCNSEVEDTKIKANFSADMLSLIETKLNLTTVNASSSIAILSTEVKNTANNTYYKAINENMYFIISQVGNNYTLKKGTIANNYFVETSTITLSDNMDNFGKGDYTIENLSENLLTKKTISNGKIINIYSIINDKQTTLGWCQREGNETYRQCNNREEDEFCDDFISTVAYWSNPTIALLIAAMCLC